MESSYTKLKSNSYGLYEFIVNCDGLKVGLDKVH